MPEVKNLLVIVNSGDAHLGKSVKFNKRFYTSGKEFVSDVLWLARNMWGIRRVNSCGLISPTFRERLMLAVTAVYACRYCSYLHTRRALKSGLDHEEAAALLSGSLEMCPPEEAVALLYAQHWAESNGNPDTEAIRRLEDVYGSEKVRLINLLLRMVRVGNLAGNLWDYLLHRISRGRWGSWESGTSISNQREWT